MLPAISFEGWGEIAWPSPSTPRPRFMKVWCLGAGFSMGGEVNFDGNLCWNFLKFCFQLDGMTDDGLEICWGIWRHHGLRAHIFRRRFWISLGGLRPSVTEGNWLLLLWNLSSNLVADGNWGIFIFEGDFLFYIENFGLHSDIFPFSTEMLHFFRRSFY